MIDYSRPNGLAPIDVWISSDDIFAEDYSERIARRNVEVARAIDAHSDRNEYFRRYREALGEGVVPYLPSSLFKTVSDRISEATAEDSVRTTSSGTQGSVSTVIRDDATLNRFFGSINASVQELLGIQNSETVGYNLGPTVEESNHLWISYVMAGVSLYFDTGFYVSNGTLQVETLYRDLAAHGEGSGIIVGPPALVLELVEFLRSQDRSLKLGDDFTVITIGGWKRRRDVEIARPEFIREVREGLGLASTSQVRDAFNMVELNTVILECGSGTKHVPPWLQVEALDIRELTPLDNGEIGILAYADPTAESFPAFILSDDFGAVDRDFLCSCGVQSDILSIERRINTLETRGCALKI